MLLVYGECDIFVARCRIYICVYIYIYIYIYIQNHKKNGNRVQNMYRFSEITEVYACNRKPRILRINKRTHISRLVYQQAHCDR
jgi:hypothetical protein